MRYLTVTLTDKSKDTTKPWFSRLRRHPARQLIGSIKWYVNSTCLLAYLLTYLPRTRTGWGWCRAASW